jgi:hypothetical protein
VPGTGRSLGATSNYQILDLKKKKKKKKKTLGSSVSASLATRIYSKLCYLSLALGALGCIDCVSNARRPLANQQFAVEFADKLEFAPLLRPDYPSLNGLNSLLPRFLTSSPGLEILIISHGLTTT